MGAHQEERLQRTRRFLPVDFEVPRSMRRHHWGVDRATDVLREKVAGKIGKVAVSTART